MFVPPLYSTCSQVLGQKAKGQAICPNVDIMKPTVSLTSNLPVVKPLRNTDNKCSSCQHNNVYYGQHKEKQGCCRCVDVMAHDKNAQDIANHPKGNNACKDKTPEHELIELPTFCVIPGTLHGFAVDNGGFNCEIRQDISVKIAKEDVVSGVGQAGIVYAL